MSLPVMVWVFKHSPTKLGARLTLLALAEFAHDDGTKAWPSVETLIERTRLSERGVRDALRRLEADGDITHTGRGKSGVNVYRINMGGQILPGAVHDQEGGSLRPEGGAESAPDPSTGPVSDPSLLVVTAAWQAESPPLIEHRDTYLEHEKTRRAIAAALKVYPADVVAEAIHLYATVLGEPAYRWDYRWNLRDFLARGLDKFVPEADPLRNYRHRGPAAQSGDDFPEFQDTKW